MNKQKQIEELAKLISQSLATKIIGEGYGMVAEARKETAREILNELNCYPHEYHEKKIKELAAVYGVEVEE